MEFQLLKTDFPMMPSFDIGPVVSRRSDCLNDKKGLKEGDLDGNPKRLAVKSRLRQYFRTNPDIQLTFKFKQSGRCDIFVKGKTFPYLFDVLKYDWYDDCLMMELILTVQVLTEKKVFEPKTVTLGLMPCWETVDDPSRCTEFSAWNVYVSQLIGDDLSLKDITHQLWECQATLNLMVDTVDVGLIKEILPAPNHVFAKMYLKEILCDVKIVSDEGFLFPCHKSVLAAYSTVFCSMFSSNYVEAEAKQVKMPNWSEAAITGILMFMYTSEIKKAARDPSLTLELFQLADAYDIKPLERIMKHFLPEKPANWFDFNLAVRFKQLARKLNDNCLMKKSNDVLAHLTS